MKDISNYVGRERKKRARKGEKGKLTSNKRNISKGKAFIFFFLLEGGSYRPVRLLMKPVTEAPSVKNKIKAGKSMTACPLTVSVE